MARAPEKSPQSRNREPTQDHTHRYAAFGRARAIRTAARGLLALVTTLTVGVLPAGVAHATPSVDEIERQIDLKWQQLEPVIEEYNKVRSQLKVNKKKQEELEKKIRPLSLQA